MMLLNNVFPFFHRVSRRRQMKTPVHVKRTFLIYDFVHGIKPYPFKRPYLVMKRVIVQSLVLVLLGGVCLSGYFLARHLLQLPFRRTNDALHQKESPINLDFLIPGGINIGEKMTIKEVINARFRKKAGIVETTLKSLSNLIPRNYLYLADFILFASWVFLYLTFLRVFTFAGYGRALRVSLFLGGCTYYFMPDFSPGKTDDVLVISAVILILGARAYLFHRRKRTKQ
jgi:hypothetical protein